MKATDPFVETVATVGRLVERAARVGGDLLAGLGRSAAPTVARVMSAVPALVDADCSCDIPPPCWYPLLHGEVTSHVCPGGRAVLRIRVTNCGPSSRMFRASAPEQGVSAKPDTFSLDPFERQTVTLSLDVDDDAPDGFERQVLVRVRGCREHVWRWTVRSARRGASSCHEVDVDDCPDPVHHWYDHFYCQHPCPPQRDRPEG